MLPVPPQRPMYIHHGKTCIATPQSFSRGFGQFIGDLHFRKFYIKNMSQTAKECIELLKAYKEKNAGRHGIERMGIFGSVARGEQKENSDIDIYYEGKPQSLMDSLDLHGELEKLFGKKIDLIRKHSNMSKSLQKQINRDVIYV
jgi:predicted nucleotidyltransferase